MDRHWRRGGFPLASLARSEAGSFAWRQQFVRTFLERDLPTLGLTLPGEALMRFFTMVAHYYGGVWNAADPARALGVSEPSGLLHTLLGLATPRELLSHPKAGASWEGIRARRSAARGQARNCLFLGDGR